MERDAQARDGCVSDRFSHVAFEPPPRAHARFDAFGRGQHPLVARTFGAELEQTIVFAQVRGCLRSTAALQVRRRRAEKSSIAGQSSSNEIRIVQTSDPNTQIETLAEIGRA